MIWVVIFFLTLVVFAALVSSLGVLFSKDAFDRLHYLGPVTLLGSISVLLAVFVYDGFTILTGKTAVTVLILLATGPVITHSIARAGIIRGDAKKLRNESWEVKK